jgi:hypothetical protein
VHLLILLSSASVHAQRDTTRLSQVGNDTNKVAITKQSVHPPKRAALMSACLPGLGQIYNRKIWKVPIIYAGFGGLGYGFAVNQSRFAQYRDALRVRYDDDPNTIDNFPQYSDDNLVTFKQFYQRWRDLTVIGMVALYTLNVIDAAVDAHLFHFSVDDNLSLHVMPYCLPTFQNTSVGLGVRLSWH